MNENDLFNFQLEYTFTADWLAELDRQLALLLSTREGTMPLDRAFGLNMDFVDMPPEAAKSLYTAEVTGSIPVGPIVTNVLCRCGSIGRAADL